MWWGLPVPSLVTNVNDPWLLKLLGERSVTTKLLLQALS